MIGQTVSHYRIVEKLGSGGMGVVYQAEDTRLGRMVALKFLPQELADEKTLVERFRREARAASALDHPNICGVHDIEEYDGQLFIVMQFVKGQTIKERVANEPLKPSDILDLGIEICDALEAAHAKGIVHRDIKPSNIMVTARGRAKILDFGLAKLVHDGVQDTFSDLQEEDTPSRSEGERSATDSLTRRGGMVGTPAYMSPEQICGRDLDPRTDLFSLGLVLYEMATRRRAFEGEAREIILENVLTHTPPPPSRSNPELPLAFDDIIHKLLEKDRELRYQTAGDVRADLKRLRRDSTSSQGITPTTTQTQGLDLHKGFSPSWLSTTWSARFKRLPAMARLDLTTAFILLLAVVVGLIAQALRTPVLTERDFIVLSHFDNTTGDPVFDGTLKQALTVQLEQSPFLNILAESRVRETLRFMGRSHEERISREVAREICLREGIKALVTGSISTLGAHYIVAIQTVEAQTGSTIANEQVEVSNKEDVLKGLGQAASRLRAKLGESLTSIQKFDVPLDQATTPSLEALRAFTLGNAQRAAGREYESIDFFQRALELDPQFALAEARLSTVYQNMEETGRAMEHGRRAYDLRDRVSERERYYIIAHYDVSVLGDIEQSMSNYEMWKRAYPNDSMPAVNLSAAMNEVGHFDRALAEAQLVMNKVDTNRPFAAINIAAAHMGLGRFREARQVLDRMLVDNPAASSPRVLLFMVGCATGDDSLMRQQLEQVNGKESEAMMHLLEAQSVASRGELKRAREVFSHAGDMARRFNRVELGATVLARRAWVEAEFGNSPEARALADAALRESKGKEPTLIAALALARAGDTGRARKIAEEMAKQFPSDSILNAVSLPSIRASIELERGNPQRAVELLQGIIPYELGFSAGVAPTYLRGTAYLKAGDGVRAAEEFQKIIARPGVESVSPLHSLSHLALARAYALSGDMATSKTEYREFLSRWNAADPAIPIFRQAQHDMARM